MQFVIIILCRVTRDRTLWNQVQVKKLVELNNIDTALGPTITSGVVEKWGVLVSVRESKQLR